MHRPSGELDSFLSVVACVIIDTRKYSYRDNCPNYRKKGSKLIINRRCVCNQQFSGAGHTPLHITIYTNAEILNLCETNSRIALNISCQLQSFAISWPLANKLRDNCSNYHKKVVNWSSTEDVYVINNFQVRDPYHYIPPFTLMLRS